MKVFANKDPHTSFNIRPADLRRLLLNPQIKRRRTMLHLNLLFPTRKHSNTLIGFLLVSRIFSKQKFLFVSFSNSELKEKKKSSCIFGTQLLFQENWLWKKKKRPEQDSTECFIHFLPFCTCFTSTFETFYIWRKSRRRNSTNADLVIC